MQEVEIFPMMCDQEITTNRANQLSIKCVGRKNREEKTLAKASTAGGFVYLL